MNGKTSAVESHSGLFSLGATQGSVLNEKRRLHIVEDEEGFLKKLLSTSLLTSTPHFSL